MRIATLFTLSVVLATQLACGSGTSKTQDETQGEGSQTDKAEQATPDGRVKRVGPSIGAIVRVPVDLSGKEDLAKADFRAVTVTEHPKDAAGVTAAFVSGKVPENVKNELDADSSTESWGSWGGSCGGYGGYGSYDSYYDNYGGDGYGYGGYYGSYYYNYWRPSCNYYGDYYGYGSPSYYDNDGYNYYYYPSTYY